MTYRAALIKTAIFVPVSLTDRAIWRSIGVHAGELVVALAALAGRLSAIALYPLSVPILAALVIASERRDARERERIVCELRAALKRNRYEHGRLFVNNSSHR